MKTHSSSINTNYPPRRFIINKEKRKRKPDRSNYIIKMSKKSKAKSERKATAKLTKLQHRSLGATIPLHIWNDSYSGFYPKISKEFIDESLDEVQSYDTFVKMGDQPPNEKGEGRFKLDIRRDKLGIIILQSLKKNTKDLEKMALFLSNFYEAYFYPLKPKVLRPLEMKYLKSVIYFAL